MSSSMGRTILIYEMENKIHVWNHQPAVSSPEATPRKTGSRARLVLQGSFLLGRALLQHVNLQVSGLGDTPT